MPNETGNVLAFDRVNRRSSRSLKAAKVADEQRETAQDAEALAMGLAADGSDLYNHSHLIRDVEAAYAKSASDGRTALVAALMAQYGDGYDTGSADAILPLRAGRWR